MSDAAQFLYLRSALAQPGGRVQLKLVAPRLRVGVRTVRKGDSERGRVSQISRSLRAQLSVSCCRRESGVVDASRQSGCVRVWYRRGDILKYGRDAIAECAGHCVHSNVKASPLVAWVDR